MGLTEVRREIEEARDAAAAAGLDDVRARLDHVLDELAGDVLLTTTETARMLGIGSVNTIKAMVHAGQIRARKVGTHYRIPLTEVARLRNDPTIRGLAATDHLHDAASALGIDDVLTQEEMDILAENRPGTLPWKRRAVPADRVTKATT
jgi:excisionase family DNA binding protein